MIIKAIKKIDKNGQVTGIFDYRSLGGNVGEITVDLDTVRSAKNFFDFSEKISALIELSEQKKVNGVFTNFQNFEKKLRVFGRDIIEESAIKQLENCLTSPEDIGVLTPDAHLGYSHSIGGAIGYKNLVSLSGVGFDIGCGNKAVRTDINAQDIEVRKIMRQIEKEIGFGTGRPNPKPIDHPILDKIAHADFEPQRNMIKLASEQLGTVGSSNHFVDLFEGDDGFLWIGVHFGSRGFGHKTTTGFMSLSKGMPWSLNIKEDKSDVRPILFEVTSEIGQSYINAVRLAGDYAYAGRDVVVDKVLEIIGTKKITFEVHNHHNFLWEEEHFGEKYWVIRKGCTPAFPGQKGFIGANMRDNSVIIEGIDSDEAKAALYSTVHGAGRVISRTKASGKGKWQKTSRGNRHKIIHTPGVVDWNKVKSEMKESNIILVGSCAEEAPECYKKLEQVLSYQSNSIKILHTLKPIGVAMASKDIVDPYASA